MAKRVIIVHTLEHAKMALKAAAELNKPVTLQSAPDAIFYAGSLYLWQMFEQAKIYHPGVSAQFILDCGDAGAEAIAAIGIGHKHIRVHDPKLQDIAKQHGVQVHSEPYEALDLLYTRDTKAACTQWLRKEIL